ncbi:hypothetical protein AOX55_0000240 [Sinorhizobium fredii CCBAU 25509]|nr:hypothetical protein AOX55_0000240 [Sinorhizobium fredii CCBAU 25509]
MERDGKGKLYAGKHGCVEGFKQGVILSAGAVGAEQRSPCIPPDNLLRWSSVVGPTSSCD